MNHKLQYIILIAFVNLSCSTYDSKDWSFLEQMNLQMIVGKNCPVELANTSVPKPPQDCYALIGILDLYQWEKEEILSENEIRILKKSVLDRNLDEIPKVIIKRDFMYIDNDKFQLEQIKGNIFKKYGITEYSTLSTPIWVGNKKVILFVNHYNENEMASNGEVFIFEKVKSKWRIVFNTDTWIS